MQNRRKKVAYMARDFQMLNAQEMDKQQVFCLISNKINIKRIIGRIFGKFFTESVGPLGPIHNNNYKWVMRVYFPRYLCFAAICFFCFARAERD